MSIEPKRIDFPALLNSAQLEAVTAIDLPVCILAGAGTGKTRVITHRIAYLIENKAEPEKILGVTFTNKAAAEMRARVDKIVPGVAHRVVLGTFHGVSARILRRYGFFVDVPSSFLIYDQDDSQKMLRQIALEQFQIGREYLDFYQQQIEQWQNEGTLPAKVETGGDFRLMRAKELYDAYWRELMRIGALDFNGLLLKWRELLLHPEGSKRLFEQFHHILVDEYQDTNAIQAEIIQILGKNAETIAIVGDDDQSIYSWRGAKASNMQKFMDDMPGAKLVKLERNYRSTTMILDAANAVISQNKQRLGKNLVAVAGGGTPIRLMRAFHDRQEAEMIVNLVQAELARGLSLDAFAVLMRTNAQSRPFEESLRKARLPYRLIGGIKFYDRREVKDVLATLRAAINFKSDVDFLRALHAIPRGIGDASIKKAQDVAKSKELSLMEIFLSEEFLKEANLSSKTADKMHAFALQLSVLGQQCLAEQQLITQSDKKNRASQGDFWLDPVLETRTEHRQLNAEEAIALAAQISGIVERLQEDKSEDAQTRIDNIGQLLSAAQQHVEDAQSMNGDTSALGFLEATALLSAVDDINSREGVDGALTLMTLHAAKGLEFDIVFMVGMEEYGFPHARALGEGASPNDLEEERRLAYVGITRARKRLYLTYAQRRLIHGAVKGRVPSRFLRELPKSVTVGDMPPDGYGRKDSDLGFSSDSNIRMEIDSEFLESVNDSEDLRKGARVVHATFGEGTVSEVRGGGALVRAVVRFDREGKDRAIIGKYLRII